MAIKLLLVALILSLGAHFLMMRMIMCGSELGLDHLEKVQKFHDGVVPRVSGVPIFLTLVPISIFGYHIWPDTVILIYILGSSIPVLFAGLLEDFRSRGYAYLRLLAAFASAATFVIISEHHVMRTEISIVDQILEFKVIAILCTILGIAVLTNGLNIIDGFNGLAVSNAIASLTSLGYLAVSMGLSNVTWACALLVSVLAGFVVFNYPLGKIFLGDGGAYFLGFFISCTLVVLSAQNEISPICLLLIAGYPLIETVFSFLRKVLVRGKHPFSPDKLHLHMLVYYFLEKKLLANGKKTAPWVANSLVAVILSPLSWMPLTIINFEVSDSEWLLWAFGLYCTGYLVLYFCFFWIRGTEHK